MKKKTYVRSIKIQSKAVCAEYTFFLENSCRNSFTHSVKPYAVTAPLCHLSADYIIQFSPWHPAAAAAAAAVKHYVYALGNFVTMT